MSGDWEVGDLALCVDASDRTDHGSIAPLLLKSGGLYRVEWVVPAAKWKSGWIGKGLALFGVRNAPNPDFAANRFIKVTPPKADAFDLETINLMNPKPVEAVR